MLNPILTAHGFGKGGGGIEYKRVTAAIALRDKQGIIADTSGGSFIVSLPNSPREGTQCSIADGGNWSTNPLTVDPGATAIENQAVGETLTLDIGSIEAQFVYTGTKWKVFVKVVSSSNGFVTTEATQTLNNKTLGSTSVAGNMSFTGTGRRILGDFSNAVHSLRTLFQTSTANSNTIVGVLPSGTAGIAQLNLYGNSDPNNASVMTMLTLPDQVSFRSNATGTGQFLPMTWWVGGSEQMRLDTSGNLSLGATTPLLAATGRTYLSLKGKGTTATDACGVMQFQVSAAGSLLPNLGNIEWHLNDNTTASTTRAAYITVSTAGAAANNRGTQMIFATKADGDATSSGTGRMTITENGHLVPYATNAYDLGSTTNRWRNIYTQDLHLSNGIGDYTMIEGEENLYLVNNKNNKHYKFALISVDPSEVPPKSEAANGS